MPRPRSGATTCSPACRREVDAAGSTLPPRWVRPRAVSDELHPERRPGRRTVDRVDAREVDDRSGHVRIGTRVLGGVAGAHRFRTCAVVEVGHLAGDVVGRGVRPEWPQVDPVVGEPVIAVTGVGRPVGDDELGILPGREHLAQRGVVAFVHLGVPDVTVRVVRHVLAQRHPDHAAVAEVAREPDRAVHIALEVAVVVVVAGGLNEDLELGTVPGDHLVRGLRHRVVVVAA